MRSDGSGSRITGFSKKDQRERLTLLAERGGLALDETAALLDAEALPFDAANHMIENAVGVLGLPLGVALNFRIDGRDRLVPMAVEEPSVVAAASYGARLAREGGGFDTETDEPVMIGQVQLLRVPDPERAKAAIEAAAERLMRDADACHPNMIRRGGGSRGLEVRILPETAVGPMVVVHLLVDVGDAMGANAINTMVEVLAPDLEKLSGGEARMRILSNLADRRRARAGDQHPGLYGRHLIDDCR